MTDNRISSAARVRETRDALLRSLTALRLEVPDAVWQHHHDVLKAYLDAVADAMGANRA